ncbi:MAG: PACE efflux transporter [Paracoccus sp. (in: a-proteobacteria)]|jgi:uncharacterized membrane protein
MQTRSFSDRVRHALSFEIVGLAIFTPLATLAFDKPAADMGMIGLISSTVATLWNFVFNVGFDRAMLRMTGSAVKSMPVRVLHTLMFEGGLLILLVPMIAWYLAIPLMAALMMDLAIMLFYLVYTFFFNIAYDRVYPLPETRAAA